MPPHLYLTRGNRQGSGSAPHTRGGSATIYGPTQTTETLAANAPNGAVDSSTIGLKLDPISMMPPPASEVNCEMQ